MESPGCGPETLGLNLSQPSILVLVTIAFLTTRGQDAHPMYFTGPGGRPAEELDAGVHSQHLQAPTRAQLCPKHLLPRDTRTTLQEALVLLPLSRTRGQAERSHDRPVTGHDANPGRWAQGPAPLPVTDAAPQADLLAASSSVPVSSTLLRLCSACVSSGTSSSPSACRTDRR